MNFKAELLIQKPDETPGDDYRLYLTFEEGYLLPKWLQEVLKAQPVQGLRSLAEFTSALIKHCDTGIGVSPTPVFEVGCGPGVFQLLYAPGLSWKDTFWLSAAGDPAGIEWEEFLEVDFSAFAKEAAHWSDPVFTLPRNLEIFYFGAETIPKEAEERWEHVSSRTGLATAWMLYWIESEFGQRDEGITLHPTKEAADRDYKICRLNGHYPGGGGYLGPVAGVSPKEVRVRNCLKKSRSN